MVCSVFGRCVVFESLCIGIGCFGPLGFFLCLLIGKYLHKQASSGKTGGTASQPEDAMLIFAQLNSCCYPDACDMNYRNL